MDSTKNYERVNAVFQGLRNMIESNQTYLFDDNLKIHIENLCKQFQLKKDVKITFCIICDNLDNKSTLIDALLKEKISDRLRSNHQYLVKSDPSIQKTIIGDENQTLCTISIEKERLKLLNNSNIVLSFEKYSKFMENIQITNAYKPDVVVLVINSPKDLEKDNIQSFFDSIKGEFNDGNFIFVLNEGRDVDCTATNICDVCYPSNIRYLFSGHKLDNREFKISASQCLNIPSEEIKKVLDENYENLLKALEKELDINYVMNRFKQQADNINIDIDTILESINVENLEISINEYNNKLNEKAPMILKTIETQKSNSTKDVSKMFSNNRKSFIDKKLQLRIFLDENCNKLIGILHKEILKLVEEISSNNNKRFIESLSKNINGLQEKDMKKKAHERLDEFIEGQEKNVDEQRNHKDFITLAINILEGIFDYAKEAFILFMDSFKNKATSIVDGTKKQINRAKFIAEHEKFKINLENEMKQDTTDLFNGLKNVITKYQFSNLFNENNFNSDFISTISNNAINMRGKIVKIKFFFVLFGKFLNQNFNDFFTNYFPMTDFENFHQNYESKLIDFYEKIQDIKYYNIDQKTVPSSTQTSGLFSLIFSKAKNVEIIKTKLIRCSVVLPEFELLRKDFFQETEDIIKKMLTSMNNFVKVVL